MCLAVPGEVISVRGDDDLSRVATVRFGGVTRDVSLAYVPDAQPGTFVLVHVGFAISRIDETEAQRVFAYLDEIADIEAELEAGP